MVGEDLVGAKGQNELDRLFLLGLLMASLTAPSKLNHFHPETAAFGPVNYRVGGGGSGGYPITYAVDDTQYVAFGAGNNGGRTSWTNIIPDDLLSDLRNPRNGGNALFVFALPQ